ncbi:MAG: nucleoside 2-deoxyribosyltransferase [Promethearchaeota archaeon]
MSKIIYLANCLGFSQLLKKSLEHVVSLLKNKGYEVIEPFTLNQKYDKEIGQVYRGKNIEDIQARLKILNEKIAENNEKGILKSDILLALLDGGKDVDSGVAAEIGFAFASNKTILALRMDFRPGGDNMASEINLQVEYFIKKSGGCIVHDEKDLFKNLERYFNPIKDY